MKVKEGIRWSGVILSGGFGLYLVTECVTALIRHAGEGWTTALFISVFATCIAAFPLAISYFTWKRCYHEVVSLAAMIGAFVVLSLLLELSERFHIVKSMDRFADEAPSLRPFIVFVSIPMLFVPFCAAVYFYRLCMRLADRYMALVRGKKPGDHFTPRALQTIGLARHVAVRHHCDRVEPEHMLAGMLSLNQGNGVLALRNAGIDPQELKGAIEHSFRKGVTAVEASQLLYSKPFKQCLEFGEREAGTMRHAKCGTEHLLLGILRHGTGAAAEVLSARGLTLERARDEIYAVQAQSSEG